MRHAVLTVLAVALLVTGAGPALASPPSLTSPSEPRPERAPRPPKSETTARAYSVGGMLLGPALMIIGGNLSSRNPENDLGAWISMFGAITAMVGPTAGHWYAGKTVTGGLGLRVVGAGAAIVGAYLSLECALEGDGSCNGPGAFFLLFSGFAAYLTGIVMDVSTADDSVRAWNRKHATVQVAPTVVRSGAGVALTGSF